MPDSLVKVSKLYLESASNGNRKYSVSVFAVPNYDASNNYAVVCTLCNSILGYTADGRLALYISPPAEQKSPTIMWISHFEDNVATQYCKECWEVNEVAPTW